MKDITWKVKLSQDPTAIFERLATDHGRESFWAERSNETPEGFELAFPNAQTTQVSVVKAVAGQHLKDRYFGAPTSFFLEPINDGTILTLKATVSDDEYVETHAGWVSVLLALKAQVEGGIDLRNHAQYYSWDQDSLTTELRAPALSYGRNGSCIALSTSSSKCVQYGGKQPEGQVTSLIHSSPAGMMWLLSAN